MNPPKYPRPPRTLKAIGKERWKEGLALWERGILTPDYLETWRLFCESWDELEEVKAVLKKDGEYHKTEQGYYMAHPALKRKKDLELRIRRDSQLFDLMPYSPRRTGNPTAAKQVASRPKK